MRSFLIILSIITCALGMSIRSNPSEVSFSLYATNLKKCGLIFACNTSVTILCSSINSDWKLCDSTRIIRNNNNPTWPKTFTFEHLPGSRQRWRFDVNEHSLISSKIIASFMVHVDEYSESSVEHAEHRLPNDRGSLWVQKRA